MEIIDQLENLVRNAELDEAINIVEQELLKLPPTIFQKMVGNNFLSLSRDLNQFLYDFHVFAKAKIDVKAFYSEIYASAVNYDLWFISISAFSKIGDKDNYDWLADHDIAFDEQLVVNGFELLKDAYKDYVINEKWNDQDIEKSSELCEVLIILRLQEVFRNVYRQAAADNIRWAKIPNYVAAHDSDMIYRAKV
jgi:hypothetical protein